MKLKIFLIFAVIAMLKTNLSLADCPDMLNHEFKKLHSSETVDLCMTSNAKAILFVNTASHCGFTGQFKDLEALHLEFASQGLVIMGFPSNDFRQEASEEQTVAQICYINYGVTFDMTAPISVRGDDAHPLFQYLAGESSQPRWNFNKYLFDPINQTVIHFGAATNPQSDQITTAIEALL
jgi:glutathione peroxidase